MIKNTKPYEMNGSPDFGSPTIDMLRNGKRERAAQFGLTDENEESFECNQSFPKVFHNHNKLKHTNNFSPDLNRIKGCDLNSVSFLKKNLINKNLNLKQSVLNETNSYMNASYLSTTADRSWLLYNHFVNSNCLIQNASNSQNIDQIITLNNPNKALVVINGRTTEILTANNISCELFGFPEEKLIGMYLKNLLDLSDQPGETKKQDILMESDRLDQNGRVVLCSGKIFDAFTNEKIGVINEEEELDDDNVRKSKIQISMFMQKLTDEQEPKCLCVIEPIQRIVGSFSINVKGRIKNYNANFSYIFGYTMLPSNSHDVPTSLSSMSASSVLNGKEITELIPSIKIPMSNILPEHRKQPLTGRSLQGENIPMTITFIKKQLLNEEIIFNCSLSVYTNISGLITVRPSDLKINSYNSTFSRFLFGYDDKELIDKHITTLIPNFFDPDTTSTACNRMTPLNTNNSFINAPINNSKLNNGSFLETRHTPTKQTTNKIPKFVITEVEADKLDTTTSTLDNEESELNEQKKCCPVCNLNFVTKKPTHGLMVEFNLETDEYSPNKKCANFLENMVFSPTRNCREPTSVTNTPQSTAKKTLLAKAIKNNANNFDKSNISLDEMSFISTCSTKSSHLDDANSSPSNSPCKKNVSFSKVDLSELEDTSNFDEDLCDQCRKRRLSNEKSKQEVSLLIDEQDINDEIGDHDNNKKNNSNFKRKASFNRADSDPHLEVFGDRRRSSILSDLNVNNNENNVNVDKNKKFKNQVTSTPAAMNHIKLISNTASKLKLHDKSSNRLSLHNNKYNISEGMFFARGKHNDGSFIRIFFQRKIVRIEKESNESEDLICVWVCRDPYSDKSIIDCSQMDQSQLHRTHHNLTVNEQNNYLNEYEDLRTIGRGASGFVQLAKRKIDRYEVVTKYILKSKIYKENWITDHKYGEVPLEVSILCKLDHPNLIKVLEVFQDSDHIQMVMEKHGCGMDLFEFIDRQRRHIDESLASYIFKQIVSAVSYLHSNMIVHRDIKDENIVINEKFQIKLIDFGSAAYVTKGKKFATFCGTMDYCSPDVLLGNKYYGPELDVWTCGIALYTLVFCENPFQNAEETIECILKPPFKVSKELMKLLFSILCPKPELRATIEEIESNEWVNQTVDINKFKWEEVIRDTEFHGNNAGDLNREEECNPNFMIKQQYQDKNENFDNQENQDKQFLFKYLLSKSF
ncbi:unnamed protein product [Brachionus calyciflorus]|uniref:Protein kinase domain-containing protein n=1 Tax=Brachionus calyciflorus TaxID=104777 RepID=A0A813M1T0_9BILA|nr:unnamed protein product [Brachionus calyciflorus]